MKARKKMLDAMTTQISPKEQALIAELIEAKDIEDSSKRVALEKSRGDDGFSSELYKLFAKLPRKKNRDDPDHHPPSTP
jgi:hypothetical protein